MPGNVRLRERVLGIRDYGLESGVFKECRRGKRGIVFSIPATDTGGHSLAQPR